ncbi:DMT family transporter [Oceanobacter mangrovi]|uniref:DMT family transporter n=1 Tax=Oceanobacter mangrovi TaxID=2862510 RepID=UPI001C8E2F12|nr:EamA family transporter [Oceanobacter mangrovi]
MIYWLIGLVAPLLWGTTYAVTQHWMGGMDPLWVASLRILIPGLLLMPFVPLSVWQKAWKSMVILGTFNIGIFTMLLFQAISRLPGGVAATLVSTVPLQILLIRWVTGKAPRLLQMLAAIGGSAGVALLVWRAAEPLDPIGIVLALLAGFFMSVGMLMIPRFAKGVPPLPMAAGQFLICGVVLVALVWASGHPLPHFDLPAVLAMVWIAPVGMGVGYLCWFKALQHIPSDQLSFLGLLNPLVAVFCGIALMGEQLSLVQGLGMALVLACVVLAQLKPSLFRRRMESVLSTATETGIKAAKSPL